MNLVLSKYSIDYIKEKDYDRNIFEFAINNRLFFKNILVDFVQNQKLNFNFISQVSKTDTKIYDKIITKEKNITVLSYQNISYKYSFFSVKTIFSDNNRYDLKSSLLTHAIYEILPIYRQISNSTFYYINSLKSYKFAGILAREINPNNINKYIINMSRALYSYNRPGYINYFVERTAKTKSTVDAIYKNVDILFLKNYNFYNYIEKTGKLFYNDFNINDKFDSFLLYNNIETRIENTSYYYINKTDINYDTLEVYQTAYIVLEELIKFKGFNSKEIYNNCNIKITSIDELVQYLSDITSVDFTSTEVLLEFINNVFQQYLDGTYVLDFTTVNEILKYVDFEPVYLEYEIPHHANFINLDFRNLGDVLIIDTSTHYKEISPGIYNIFTLTDTNLYVEIKDKNNIILKFNITFKKSPLKYAYVN